MKQVLMTGAAVLLLASTAFAQTTPSRPATMATPTSQTAPARTASTAGMSGSGSFTNVPSQEELSSKVVGLNVYNSANKDIGKIKDVAFDSSGVKAYILSVGGVLGMGTHYVAVEPSAVTINYDSANKRWHATMNTDVDQLKAAPEFKYSSNG